MKDKSTDNQLMEMIIKEDNQLAFERLYFKYKNALVRFSYGYTFNQSRAEEMMQETFLKMYCARNRFDSNKPFRTWLWTICKNTNLDHLEKDKKEVQFHDENDIMNLVDESLESALDQLIEEASREQLEAVILALPLSQREALLLWMNDELSFDEMAEILNKTSQAVKNLVHRAKENLRKNLCKKN
jgi:RNA polymerase sigma-70 factor, ECF subfamily